MKKLWTMFACMLLMVSVACARDKVTQDVSLLPVEAREMIKRHFPNATISYLSVDNNVFVIKGYDVRLSNGTELEFNNKGQWTDVECKPHAVPASLIPAAIQKYLGQYHRDQRVVEIKHKRRGYEVKLANGLEVEFDNQGNFRRLDD